MSLLGVTLFLERHPFAYAHLLGSSPRTRRMLALRMSIAILEPRHRVTANEQFENLYVHPSRSPS